MKEKIPTAHEALEFIKENSFPGVDWHQQPDYLNPKEYPQFCLKYIEFLLSQHFGADELPDVFNKFYEFYGDGIIDVYEESPFYHLDQPENALSMEELRLVKALERLSFVSAYLYNHQPFDLSLLGVPVDEDHRFDFTVTNMALCYFVEHTPYRRVAVMLAYVMYWVQFDAIVANNLMLQDYLAFHKHDYGHDHALKEDHLACDEYIEMVMVDLRRLRLHEVTARDEYGMDADDLIIYDELSITLEDEFDPVLVAVAKRLKTLTDQLLEKGGNKYELAEELVKQAQQLVEENGLWVDETICYNYLREFFASKYDERFDNPS